MNTDFTACDWGAPLPGRALLLESSGMWGARSVREAMATQENRAMSQNYLSSSLLVPGVGSSGNTQPISRNSGLF